MYSFERSYKAGRSVCSWLEFVGWAIVILGGILTVVGFASGGIMGMASSNFGRGDIPFIVRMVSMIPGVLMAAGGLMSIMLAQHTKATIDTAEMTREMLKIAKNQSNGAMIAGNSPLPTADPGDVIKVYQGQTIIKEQDGVSVGENKFANVNQAQRWLDGG